MIKESFHKKMNRNVVQLNLGCGPGNSREFIGIDSRDLDGVDVVHDLEQPMDFLKDSSVDSIFSKSFLEHIVNLHGLMKECWRVLKKGGEFMAIVPHFSNPHYYSDPTHRRFFGLYSFEYFCPIEDQYFYRKVPNYWPEFKFKTRRMQILFEPPNSHLQGHVNGDKKLQELYERELCWSKPCYGLAVNLEAVK